MFGALKRVANNAISLNREKILVTIWSNNNVQQFIVDLNRIDQLFKKGIDSVDDLIGVYSFDQGVVRFKGNSKNKKKGSPIALFDTGDFYRSFEVRVRGDDFIISADDEKEGGDLLTEKFGKDIIGLTDDSIEELAQKILPIIVEQTLENLRK